MDIIGKIKQERFLSKNHWRFKIIEWTLDESMIPACIYRAYCPLFHLSNLFALTFPLILIVKTIIFLMKCGAKLGNLIVPYLVKPILKKKLQEERFAGDSDIEDITDSMANFIVEKELETCSNGLIAKLYNQRHYVMISDSFAKKYAHIFENAKELAIERKKELKKMLLKKEEIEKKKEEQRKAAKEKLIPLIHASEFIAKILFWCLLATVTCTVGYFSLFYVTPEIIAICVWSFKMAVEFLSIVFSWESLKLLVEVISFLDEIAIAALAVYLIKIFVPVRKICKIAKGKMPKIKIPNPLAGSGTLICEVVNAFLLHIHNICVVTIDFVETLYSNNCPPVTIIDEEE